MKINTNNSEPVTVFPTNKEILSRHLTTFKEEIGHHCKKLKVAKVATKPEF